MNQTTNHPAITLVIPAFEEARRLPEALRKLEQFRATFGTPIEIILVVEKSHDGTLELAATAASGQEHFRVLDNKVHRGKGFAVRTGMLAAMGSIVFYMDADLSVPLAEVGRFVTFFGEHPNVDVLVGNRQHSSSRIVKRQSPLRQKMGQAFNRLLQTMALVSVRDTQCGFKAFRREAALEIFRRQTLDGFAFDVEILVLAEKLGYRCADMPVEWQNSPESKVHIVRHSLEMLRDAFRVRRIVEGTLRKESTRRTTG